MPVRNEGVNIKIMLKILEAVLEVKHEILIIHDDPSDDSIDIINHLHSKYPYVKLVLNNLGKGVVNAIKKGIEVSSGEYILIFAVDEVGPVLAIDDMIALLDDGCDFVSCTRYAYGGRRLGGSYIGGVLSRYSNRIFRLLSGTALTDSTTGIKMFKKNIMNRIQLEAKPVGWAVVFELAIKCQLLEFKLGEVPIISIDRLFGGKSTFKLGPWVKEYLRWFWWGVKHLHSIKNKQKIIIKHPTQFN